MGIRPVALGDLEMNILLLPAFAIAGIFFALLFRGIERVLAARMQARIGPPLVQPFIDVKKLFLKENIVPKDAVKWIFELMPVVALTAAIAVLLYIPLFGLQALLEGYGDLVLVLYLLAVPSLAMALGGFASSSPYATVGAQREIVTMLGYEMPLAITIASIAWLVSAAGHNVQAFSLAAISSAPVWGLVGPLGIIGLLLLFLVMIFVMPGETGALPFDAAEAETEIAGGLLVEYSGRNLALFYVAGAVKAFAFASLVVAIFLPWEISGTLGMQGILGNAGDAIFFLVKVFAVMFFGSIFARVAVARLRITQIVKVYWAYAAIAALFGLVLVSIDLIGTV
ncbi:MAG: complex I subunit 1 family protein [archaeon]